MLSLVGYHKIITYTLDSEPGTSLRAAGWTCAGPAGGERWTGRRRPAADLYPAQMKLRYEKLLLRKGACDGRRKIESGIVRKNVC